MPVPPPPQQPTFYFVGVSTGQSSSRRVFPRWMAVLGRPEVVLQGVDFPLHDDPANYRAFVAFVRREPLALGGLVTTHKVDLLHAAADLFDELSPAAAALQEVSSIARRGDRLLGHATDPSAGGISLDAITGPGYFGATGAHVLCLGAGGAAAAVALHLLSKPDPADRPARFIVVNRSPGRLESLRAIVAPFGDASRFDYILNEVPRRNDELMAALPDHSIVINATGMGKDRPGSPVTDAGRFPHRGIAWELNYRGELDFLRQAQRQQAARQLVVEDGWLYFLHGWTQVISHVLDLPIDTVTFDRLTAEAESLR